MRYLATIGYWMVAVLLLACVTTSFGYDLRQALFLATSMLPGMFCAKRLLPDIFRTQRRKLVAGISVAAGVLVVEWLFIFFAHLCTQHDFWRDQLPFPVLFSNPAFLALLLAAIVIPEMLLARWLDVRLPRMRSVTFISERRKVTLSVADILYVESNDSEVMLHTADGDVFRTKTRISQWEHLLDDRFVRIHRSWLVNADHVAQVQPRQLTLGNRTLDISRKYREEVSARFRKQADRVAGVPFGTNESPDAAKCTGKVID